jgi:preprotein translocase subunit SecA
MPSVYQTERPFSNLAAGPKIGVHFSQQASDSHDMAALITDAYATVAVAYRRAAGLYAIDEEMQKLGTAAVHLLTIATSHMKAHPDEDAS